MPNIDNLSIKIKAEADSANKSLQRLISQIDKVSSSLSKAGGSGFNSLSVGINRLSTSMQNFANTTTTGNFTRLKNNLNAISNINSAGLNNTAASLNLMVNTLNRIGTVSDNAQKVAELARGISQLGSVKVQSAITNMPKLASALRNLVTTLAKTPAINRNLIDLINSISTLSTQYRNLTSVTNSYSRATKAMNSTVKSSTSSTKSFASAIGKFYATYFILMRAFSALWKSIKKSMDYGEVVNYFEASFTQVSEKADLSAWSELGYESADEYYKSFKERAESYTAQLTGYAQGSDGVMSATGSTSLGLNPTQVMNVQSVFGQISSSMNVTSEDALKLSRVMVELGADIASVKNEDFETTWKSLQSGLVGMSRAVDKYGVNLREANLQQKLTDLGINATVDSLGQQDKALLRTIIMLDSTKYAWSDMADTIQSPANQIRLLQSNLTMLSQALGNLFAPLVASILPYVRAFTIALTQLLEQLRQFFNIGGFDWGSITGSSSDLSDIYDALGENIDSATDSAKELKAQLMGFDEINKLEDKTDTSTTGTGTTNSAISDAFNKAYEEYQNNWNKSFANVDDKAQDIAGKLEKYFTKIGKVIEKLTPVFEGFFDTFGDATGILFDTFTRALNTFFNMIMKLDPDFLYSVGDAIAYLATAFIVFKGFTGLSSLISGTASAFSTLMIAIKSHPIIATATAITTLAIALTRLFFPEYKLSDSIVPKLSEEISNFKKEIEELLDEISGARDTRKQAIDDIDNTYDGIKGLVDKYYDLKEVQEPTNEQLAEMQTIYEKLIKDVPAFKKILDDTNISYDEQKKAIDDTITSLKQKAKAEASYEFLIEAEKEKIKADKALIKSENEYGKNAENLYKEWVRITDLKKAKEEEYLKALAESQTLGTKASKEKAAQLEKEYDELVQLQANAAANYKTVKAEQDALTNASKQASTDITYYSGIISGEISGSAEDYKNYVEYVEVQNEKLVSNMQKTGEELGKNLIDGTVAEIKKDTTIGDAIKNMFKELKPTLTIGSITYGSQSLGNKLALTLPTKAYATGGIVEDGLFYANHNELVGGFGNRTAVANNEQIVDGIKRGVYEAMISASSNNNVNVTLQLDGKTVSNVVIDNINRMAQQGYQPLMI